MADVVDTWSYGDQNTKDWLHDGDVERSAADIIDTAENVAALGEQITAAAAQAVLDVNAAGSEQMAAIEGVTASQVAIVEAAGTAQAAAVAAEGASQIAAIDNKASDVIDSIQETVQEQAMSLLEAAIDAQETAIANAGTAQIAAIDAEGAALVADAEAARDDAVSAKDAALASQAAAATAAANAAASEAAALAAADSASANASAAGVSAANAETAATQAAAAADAAMSVTDFDKYQHVNTKAWANTVDYSPGAIAKGSDGNLYVALQASGPSSTAVNPVGDSSGKWDRIVSQSEFGSNYIRFSSGLQICWGSVTIATASTAVTFPKAFSATPDIVFGLRPGSASERLYNVLAYPRSTTGFTAYANDADGHMAAVVSYIAIGSWA